MLKAKYHRLGTLECDPRHPMTRSDIEWFKEHPNRTHRARNPYHGQIEALALPEGVGGWRVIVMQWEPGDLAKIVIDWNERHEIETEDDAVLETLFVAAWKQTPITRAQVVGFTDKLRPDETVKH